MVFAVTNGSDFLIYENAKLTINVRNLEIHSNQKRIAHPLIANAAHLAMSRKKHYVIAQWQYLFADGAQQVIVVALA